MGLVPHSKKSKEILFIEHRILKPGNARVEPNSQSIDKETEAQRLSGLAAS